MNRIVEPIVALVGISAALGAASSATPVQQYLTQHYSGQAAGAAMSFDVSDGKVQHFTFVNACPGDVNGTPVSAQMRISHGRFSYRDSQFTITGRFSASDLASGTERDVTGDCDSGILTWTARLVSGTITPTPAQRAGVLRALGDPPTADRCLQVQVAASNHSYATVRIISSKSCEKLQANGVSVYQRGSQGRWRLVFAGSAYRCPIAHVPQSVQRDLGVCPLA